MIGFICDKCGNVRLWTKAIKSPEGWSRVKIQEIESIEDQFFHYCERCSSLVAEDLKTVLTTEKIDETN